MEKAKMASLNNLVISAFVLVCALSSGSFKQIPSYIQVCKREQNTIDKCVQRSIEALKPQLIAGIPEINVPGIDPFFIPEVNAVSGDSVPLKATGKNIKVTGAGDFSIKSLTVDLDGFTVRARVRFPKLHFEGRYKLDTQILVLRLQGQGNLVADAVKCDAELVLRSETVDRNGEKYLKFTSLDVDVNIKDYRIKLEGLFNGDKVLGEAANQAINQNRGEFLVALKPSLEKTVSKLFLDAANKIVDDLPLKDVLPEP